MTASDLLVFGLTNATLATLLAAAGWLLARAWGNPHVASVVWLVVLLKLVTPPVVSLPVSLPREREAPAEPMQWTERSAATDESGVFVRETREFDGLRALPSTPIAFDGASEVGSRSAQAAKEAAREPLTPGPSPEGEGKGTRLPLSGWAASASWPAAVVMVWLGGTAALLALTAARVVRFRRTLRRTAVPEPAIKSAAAKVAAGLGLRRCPVVVSVATEVGPMVWAGAGAPVVIVPRPLWDRLGEAERETLLAHELAHLVRGDHWVQRFEAVVLALYWWLPTAWLAVRRREAAAESCCDALVLASYPDGSRPYAEALYVAASVLCAGRRPVPLASGLGGSAELKERLSMIVQDRVPRRPSRAVRWGLALVAVVVLGVSGQWVQADLPSDQPKGATTPVEDSGSKSGESPAKTTSAAEPDQAADAAEEAADSASGLDQALPATGPFRGGFARPGMAGGRGMGMAPTSRRGMRPRPPVQLSAEVRGKMIESLVAVIEQGEQPAEVRAQALRSLGQIGQGAPAAEKALLSAVGRAEDDNERLAVAEALNAVGSAKGVETMWGLLEATKDWGVRGTVVERLAETGAVPETPQATRTLAWLAARGAADVKEKYEARAKANARGSVVIVSPFEGAEIMLRRLTESGDGVRLLVDTIRTADEPSRAPVGFVETPEGAKSRIEEIYGTETPVRDLLLPLLKSTVPQTDEIAVALVEALASDDAAIREAAAQALGNAGPEVSVPGFEGMGMPGAAGPPGLGR